MDETTAKRIEQLERQVASLQRRLDRPRFSGAAGRGSNARWAGMLALLAVASVPMLAWTYAKPHPDFTPGTPISSAEVNETVDDVYSALNALDAENARVTGTVAVNAVGALPVAGGFESQGGTVVLFVSGSAWRNGTDGAGSAGIEVLVDDVSVGQVRTFTNETGSHKALVSRPFVLEGLTPGMHDVSVTALAGTSSDANDSFEVLALELPR